MKKENEKEKQIQKITVRASGASIWSKCYYSLIGSDGGGSHEDIYLENTAAEKGTQAHAVLEALINNAISHKEKKHEEVIKDVEKNVGKISPEFLQYAKEATGAIMFDYIYKYKAKAILETEKRMYYTYKVLNKGLNKGLNKNPATPAVVVEITGQYDALIYDQQSNTLHIYDFKSGRADVPAHNNKQLEIYAALYIYTNNIEYIKNVSGTIIQPATGTVSHGSININSHNDAEKYLKGIALNVISHVVNNGADAITGPHCRYCKINDICPTLRELRNKYLNPKIQDTIYNRPEMWREILLYAKTFETLIQTVKDKAKSAIEAGEKIEGLRLLNKSGRRTWSKEIDVLRILQVIKEAQKSKGAKGNELIKEDDLFINQLKTPADVIELCDTLGIDGKEILNGLFFTVKYNAVSVDDGEEKYF